MFLDRSKALFISSVLSTIWICFLFIVMLTFFVTDNINQFNFIFLIVFLRIFIIAVFFNWFSFIKRKPNFLIVSIVIYFFLLIGFSLFFLFSVPIIILSIVGYSNQKDINLNIKNLNENSI